MDGRRDESTDNVDSSLSRIHFPGIKSIPDVLITDDLMTGTMGGDDGEPLDGGSMSTTVVTSTGGIVVRLQINYDIKINNRN